MDGTAAIGVHGRSMDGRFAPAHSPPTAPLEKSGDFSTAAWTAASRLPTPSTAPAGATGSDISSITIHTVASRQTYDAESAPAAAWSGVGFRIVSGSSSTTSP